MLNNLTTGSGMITAQIRTDTVIKKELEEKQKKWDKTFINSLSLYETHSKCSAKKVACILVKDNNILSIGINGTISGKENCNTKFRKTENGWQKSTGTTWNWCHSDEHHKWSNFNEIHAELNAIKKASQNNGFNLEGSTAYISFSPCFNCSKMLVLFGIKRVIFKKEYDDWQEVRKFLEDNGIEYSKIEEESSSFQLSTKKNDMIDIFVDLNSIFNNHSVNILSVNINSYNRRVRENNIDEIYDILKKNNGNKVRIFSVDSETSDIIVLKEDSIKVVGSKLLLKLF